MSPRISTYALTMDSSLPCISHIASFQQNNMIFMEGTPPMSSYEDETGVKLIIIIITWADFGLIFLYCGPWY